MFSSPNVLTATRMIQPLEADIEQSLQMMGWNGKIGRPNRLSPLSVEALSERTYMIMASLDDLVIEMIIEEDTGRQGSPIPKLCQLKYTKI